jgi:ectoine hydroxylase
VGLTNQTAMTPTPGMTDEQRKQFEEDGFVVVPGALGPGEVDHYAGALDDLYDRTRHAGQLAADGSLQRLGAVRTCPPLAGLLDHPAVFPLVWSVLGWNIHVCHSHINVHPMLPPETPPRWRWHQDGSRQCLDLETDPPPRLSVFVGYWLSDLTATGRGNLTLIPGSQTKKWLPGPPDPTVPWPAPDGAVELTAAPGDAVMFDRRLWHTRSDNHSAITRKVVFLGYTFRWIFSRDNLAGIREEPWYTGLSPVQQQMLGAGDGSGDHQWGMLPDDVPLYCDLRDRGLLDPGNRLHRRFVP